jgi:hypothetical protein
MDSDIELYNNILSGKIKRFPSNHWQEINGLHNASKLSRYMFEKILQWNFQDIKENLNKYTFSQYKLAGMLTKLFNNSTYDALNNTYPNKFTVWELKQIRVSRSYWNNDDNILYALKWLFEEKLKWTNKEFKDLYGFKTFDENGLGGLLFKFNDSPFQALNFLYPNRFKPWELKNVPINYWNKQTITEACIWLFEEKLKWDLNDIRNNLTEKVFVDNGLTSIVKMCNDSPYQLVNMVYPNIFKKEELWGYKQKFKSNK